MPNIEYDPSRRKFLIDTAKIGGALLLVNACGRPPKEKQPAPEKVGVEKKYSWKSPGGTIFNFDATDFPGTFYPEAITQALGKSCDKPLVVPNVEILIGPVKGFNPNTGQPDPNGTLRGVTIMAVERNTDKPAAIIIGIAGGKFQELRAQNKYYYTSPHIPDEKVITDALSDLNGSIAEEIGFHACSATSVESFNRKSAQAESARFHIEFLKKPVVMFRPQGW